MEDNLTPNEEVFQEDGTQKKVVETEMMKCSGCGANMQFDPETQQLFCPHCGSRKQFDTDTKAEEISLQDAINGGSVWSSDETVVFSCSNCGAKVVLSKGETAKLCPFCGTAHVQKSEELAGLKPNGLVPFAFDTEKALGISKGWARKRFFAPRDFKKNLKTENVNGVYTPCFTFDSCTTSTYKGRIGKTHTRVVGVGKNRRTETYVVWKNIAGVFYDSFDDVLITAGSKLDQKKLDKISPYDTNAGKVYSENYLLGFMAYHYDSEITDCWQNAKQVIDAELRKRILAQYHYDRVDYLDVGTKHERVTYKYVMLPVYVGNFNYKKKLYNFYVNGSTGKVSGKTPKSVPKVLGAIILALAAVVGIVYVLAESGFFA